MASQTIEGTRPHLGYARPQNRQDPYITPFLNACENNDAVIALQLAPGRDASLLTFGLNRAISKHHLALGSQLLKAGAKWDSFTVSYASSSPEGVGWLVESGFDVNTSLVGGNVLLSMVVEHNDEDCIRYLLEHGADPNLGAPMSGTVRTALMRAIPNCGWTLNRAAAFCTPEIFTLLLHHGADIRNAIPLHHAAGYGPSSDTPPISSRIPMLEYLIGLGLDINALDDADTIPEDGRGRIGTPLTYAIWYRRVDEARWLIEKGADPDKTSAVGLSARRAADNFLLDHEITMLFRTA